MREIPPLHVLCLRVVGSHACSTETTFAQDENGQASSASCLLRSFHSRAVTRTFPDTNNENKEPSDNAVRTEWIEKSPPAISQIPIRRTPCIGEGSARRHNANEVDLHHPFAACKVSDTGTKLIMEYGNAALDCLQSYIDALVELGRMDDTRLGIHFFQEWKINVWIAATGSAVEPILSFSKKRKRGSMASSGSETTPNIMGSLSLHNCTLGTETIEAMVQSRIGPFLGVLDLSGIHGLTDEMLQQILSSDCGQMQRLSIKNCRRITNRGLQTIREYLSKTLVSLDVGGVYNISVDHILEAVPVFPKVDELFVSGLNWTDETLEQITQKKNKWSALALSYSLHLSSSALKQALLPTANSLKSLALAFCETVVDNALLGTMGRNFPHVQYLDLRGNPSLTTLTGWYDGRVSADLPTGQALTVLGRYSGLSDASVEETRRIHRLEPGALSVILDGTGTGLGIRNVLTT